MNESVKYQNMLRLIEQKEILTKQISAIREDLKESIPPNESVDGIRHLVISRKDVKYAEACRRIIDMIVAESKRPRAWAIVEQLTNYGQSHSFHRLADNYGSVESEALS